MQQCPHKFGHLALLIALASPSVALAQGKTVVINSSKAIEESAAGKKALASLQKRLEAAKVNIDAKDKQLKAKMEAFKEAERSGKPRKELEDRQKEIQKDFESLQSLRAGYQADAERSTVQAQEPVKRLMVETLERIAEREGYELVVDRSAAPYLRRDLDITERVIAEMNATKPQ